MADNNENPSYVPSKDHGTALPQQRRSKFLKTPDKADYQRMTMMDFENMQIGAGNMMFKHVEFPLTYDQRYQLFRQILWQFSFGYISEEDYKAISRPKKVGFIAASAWGVGFMGLNQMYSTNPERFYKKFLLTPLSFIYFAVLPLGGLYLYQKRQSQTYAAMYTKYVGKLTDEELLELDAKFQPNRKVVYQYIIKRHKEQQQRLQEALPIGSESEL
ncbi:hypothetical protein FGO68_gene8410 [Halteria grandinella]|uniref:Transmembrane protein n=1 Tax=Halteria grandinella TaxID=5974 RepID=A0A8J8NK05_HALGN|nr:hypothetical protein FGO68_gene8410 [Halteria grandinella]